jgi:membrane associated rhomboid family serine protease
MGRGMRRLGQRLGIAWYRRGPVITSVLIGLCVIVWIIEEVTTPFPRVHDLFLDNGIFAPIAFASRPWTAMTSVFFHAPGLMHIGFNMVTLWFLGSFIEKELGHWTYLAVYLISGLGGSMGIALYSRLWPRSVASTMISAYGASGAIFGLFGALIPVYMTTLRGSSNRKSTLVSLSILAVLSVLQPIVGPHIAWQAHVGGFVTGWIVTALIGWRPAWRSRLRWLTWRVWITLACIVVAAVVIVVLCGCTL